MSSLYCPIASKVHPDASSVHEYSVLWARSLGMLPTRRHLRAAHESKTGWLVARAFPTAMPRWLQLVADWTMLFCVLDDHVEKLRTAGEVATHLQHLINVFRADITRSPTDWFAAGMIDLRQRLLALAPPSHLELVAGQLEALFAGFVVEARNRERAQIPDVASYLQLREITVGLHVMFAFAIVMDGFRLSDDIREHPALRKLSARTSTIVGCANDLFSYEKEITRGEIHNLVLVLMNARRLTLTEAVVQAVALHDSEVRRFVLEIKQLPRFGVAEASVQRYVAMLGCWIRGHLDWAHETGRYRPLVEDRTSDAEVPPAGT